MAATSPRSKRILVADDDPSILNLLRRLLRQHYDVVTADDGPSALAVASKSPPPDLIILDVMMPGVDGFGLAQRLKWVPQTQNVPVIFLTAKDSSADKIRGIQLGARSYITKPFSIDELMITIKKALGE